MNLTVMYHNTQIILHSSGNEYSLHCHSIADGTIKLIYEASAEELNLLIVTSVMMHECFQFLKMHCYTLHNSL